MSPGRRPSLSLDPAGFLERILPDRSSGPGFAVGADRRAARRYHFLRLLGRKHSPRCRAVERRHQLRWRACLHLGRPDRPADFEHLPQVLRTEDGLFLLVTCYMAMVGAALVVEGLFGVLGLIPREHQASVVEATVTWNYTTWLNIGFLLLAAFLVWRFVTTGGLGMLRMMNRPARGDEAHHHVPLTLSPAPIVRHCG